MDAKREALEKFGRFLMRERDGSIRNCDNLFRDKPGTAHYLKWLHDRLWSTLGEQQMELVRYLIPMIVDKVLHNVLFGLEQCEWMDVTVTTDSGAQASLSRDLDDWMIYELDDWIENYSEERHDHLDDADAMGRSAV